MARNDDHRLRISDYDVTRIDRHSAAGDGHVEVDRMLVGQADRSRRCLAVNRKRLGRDLRRVAQAAVGDQAGCAPHGQPADQNAPRRSATRVPAAVDDEDAAGRRDFDRFSLRVPGVLVDTHMIDVFARGNVPQCKRFAHERRRLRGKPRNSLHDLVAQSTLEELGGEGRARAAGKARSRGLGQGGGRGHGGEYCTG